MGLLLRVYRRRVALSVVLVLRCSMSPRRGPWRRVCPPPDTRDLKLPGEKISFFTQHVLMVGLPMVMIARRRFHLYHPRVLYCWAVKFMLHVNVLLPVSLLFGSNLNYMLVSRCGASRAPRRSSLRRLTGGRR